MAGELLVVIDRIEAGIEAAHPEVQRMFIETEGLNEAPGSD